MVAHMMPYVTPRTLKQLVDLMVEHGSQRVTWDDMFGDFDDDGLKIFRARYFPGRRKLKLVELVPFVQHMHYDWEEVIRTVTRVLSDAEIIWWGHLSPYRFGVPGRDLPKRYTVWKQATPKSRQEFIKLMKQHATVRVTWAEARDAGACQEGLEEFQYSHFPGRKRLTLAELLPFVEYSHDYWWNVVEVVTEVLKARRVLVLGYEADFSSPSVDLPSQYWVADHIQTCS